MNIAAPVSVFAALTILLGTWFAFDAGAFPLRFSDTEPDFSERQALAQGTTTTSLPPIPEPLINGRVQWGAYWSDMNLEEKQVYGTLTRPEGPPRVGIQAGHWKLDEVPEELDGLKASTGARGGGVTEQAAVLKIAQLVQEILEKEGVMVDLIPATVPVDYVADAFVSIHADGSSSAQVSGFKISGPRRDFSGRSHDLIDALYESYEEATSMGRDDNNITRRMSGYYAFNWRRFDHALHPLVPAAIVETGFMTSAKDRAIIVAQPERAADGIAKGILTFLKQNNLLSGE